LPQRKLLDPISRARVQSSAHMNPPLFPKGNWATLLLPITESDAIDYGLLGREIDRLVEAKVDGIYSNGTAGEFHTQGTREFLEVNRLLAEKCHAAKMPFQIGANHPCAQEALERIKITRELDPEGYQVILPDWFPVTDAEARDFLEKMAAAAAPAYLVLYNPPHAKRRLSLEEIAGLSEAVSGLAGVKLPGGDSEWYASMRRLLPRLSVFIPGHFMATGLRQGAHGSYSNIACLDPRRSQRWHETILRDGESGIEIERQILAFFDKHLFPLIHMGYPNAAIDKLLAAIGGWTPLGTRLRWPYRFLDAAKADELRAAAHREMPAFFAL